MASIEDYEAVVSRLQERRKMLERKKQLVETMEKEQKRIEELEEQLRNHRLIKAEEISVTSPLEKLKLDETDIALKLRPSVSEAKVITHEVEEVK